MPKSPVAIGMQHGGNGSEVADALKAMVAPIRTLLTHISCIHQPVLLPAMFGFIKLMRSLGEEPDNGDIMTQMSRNDGVPDWYRPAIGHATGYDCDLANTRDDAEFANDSVVGEVFPWHCHSIPASGGCAL